MKVYLPLLAVIALACTMLVTAVAHSEDAPPRFARREARSDSAVTGLQKGRARERA